MNDVTLELRIEMLLDPDDADELISLKEEKDDRTSERSAYEIEQDIDQILTRYIDMADLHDIVAFELL